MGLLEKNMDWAYEENVLSILRGREGWDDNYSSLSEFIQHLNEETVLEHQKLDYGYVFWKSDERQQQQQQSQILALLKATAPGPLLSGHYLLQFWGVVKEEGRHHHLSSSYHPFCVNEFEKGVCWYRKLYRDHVYVVDMEGADEEQLGCVGRAYRSKHPVFSPDLRLYSTHQFPMRDEAARCGFRDYMAMPLFDLHTYQCYGVLELISDDHETIEYMFSSLDQGLENAGLRSTHSPISTSNHARKMQQPDSEIRDIIELAMATDPQLYMAQVWVPCKQCVDMSSNFMEMAYIYPDNKFNWWDDKDMFFYIRACEFHHLPIDVSSCQSNLCDVSTSKNPLAHFAQRARVSHCFPISLQSVTNSSHLYVIQFFLHPKSRKDAYSDYSPQLLSRIVEMNLESFKFLEDSQKPNAIDSRSIDSLNVLKSYEEELSESNFTTYLEMVADSCCLRPPSQNSGQGWAFCLPTTERVFENDVKSNPLLIKERIEIFMKKMAARKYYGKWIVQFWAPKKEKDRCYLEAFDQPYAVGCLAKGIASFRKKCMTHYYLVDEAAKEEELGPPGRVFRNGHPEISPDLFHYTEKEFLIRNYAMHCLSRQYFALPIFDDEHNLKCVGVLEFLGFNHSDLEYMIGRHLQVANLCSTLIDSHPRFIAVEPQSDDDDDSDNDFLSVKYPSFFERSENVEISLQPADTKHDETKYCRTNALTEINDALKLISKKIPQLHMANVWVPNGECFGICSNIRCMELALSTNSSGDFKPINQVCWIHVQTGKGMVGVVLASENKSCFCRNLCEFSIADQPLSHFEMDDRCNVCFAICLQSSYTGDLVYVMEFFLYQGPETCEYVRSFLNFLLRVMKNELQSFKMASGKQLGEELVVEVIEFSEEDKLNSSESEQVDVFPIKFKRVQYGQKEHQHIEEQQTEECNLASSDANKRERGKGKISFMEHQHTEEQTEECNLVASDAKKRERGKVKTGFMEHQHTEEQQTEECNLVASYAKKRERGKGKIGFMEHHHTEEQHTEECNLVASDDKKREKGKGKTGFKEHQHTKEQQTEECNLFPSDAKKRSERGKGKTGLKEHQHTEEQLTEECNIVASDAKKRSERGKGKTGLKEHQHTEEKQKAECNLAASESKKRERGKGKTDLHLELLKPYFGKKLKDVAEELGVGRSTIKRACREYGIKRWPCKEKHKKNLSLFGGEKGGVSHQETNTESSCHSDVQEEAEKVIIKVKHERVIVRFEFCLSLGLTKLIEEAATRLNLEMGSFELKYLDEDDDEILLTRDDLHLCPKNQTATGRTCIQLLVRL